MIKSTTTAFMFILALVFSVPQISAQEFKKSDVSPMDVALARGEDHRPVIGVIYSRPQKKNREIFGKLVPYGKVWRTGANEATEIQLYKDMQVSGETIKAGTYTLYTIPDEKEWTVILNKETDTWGAFNYQQELDEFRMKVPARSAAAPIESLSMAFKKNDDGVSLMIGWDTTFVEIPFKEI